jgi:hypothetical protein
MKEAAWRALAALGGAAVLAGSAWAVWSLSWEDAGWWVFVAVPPLAAATCLACWRSAFGGPVWRPLRSFAAILQLGLLVGLAWSVGLVLMPAFAQTLGQPNRQFTEWDGNDPSGWLLVGLAYAGLAAWGIAVGTRANARSSRAARIAWAVALVIVHATVALAILGRIAPNETALSFASLYEIPPALLLLLLEIDWRKLLGGRARKGEPGSDL